MCCLTGRSPATTDTSNELQLIGSCSQEGGKRSIRSTHEGDNERAPAKTHNADLPKSIEVELAGARWLVAKDLEPTDRLPPS
jgi:hypothetical protein